jgi:hypothetical protein
MSGLSQAQSNRLNGTAIINIKPLLVVSGIMTEVLQAQWPIGLQLVHPDNARITDEGNHGLPVADIRDWALEIVQPETTTEDPGIKFVNSARENRTK